MPHNNQETAIQQHFLGCSIRSFNLNVGWGNQSSNLDVSLVEDDALYERFEAFIGQGIRFQYSGWIFDGILSNIREVKSHSINRGWEVTISDPRSLLEGVQLIIDGYTGYTYSVPNLYNIFGYLESFGYGSSLKNESGIPWKLVRDAFTQLNQIVPIYLGGQPYYIDLSLLPNIQNDFRIGGGTSITLLGFIQSICDLANHEFTVVMTGNYITVITVSNNIPQLNGSIYRLINSITENYISTESGFELNYNTTNKFLIGSQVEQIYFQFNNVGESYLNIKNEEENPIYDDTIARYWGLDQNGNVNLAERGKVFSDFPQESNEIFYIDGKPISWPGTSWYNYPTDLLELRAVLESIDAWIAYLSIYKNIDPNDNPPLPEERIKKIRSSIHYGKYDRLIKQPDMKINNINALNIDTLGIKDLAVLERNLDAKNNFLELTKKVYDYLYSYASEYFGLKFMVRIPFVFAKVNDDYSISTTLEQTTSGYIEESMLPNVISNNLLPNFPYFALDEDNKIICYVRFGPFEIAELNLGELQESDYYIQDKYVFVKATVDKELVFLNKNTAFSPRVVITLPGRIKYINNIISFSVLEESYLMSIPEDLEKDEDGNMVDSKHWSDIAQKAFAKLKNQVGSSSYFIDMSKISLIPQMAAIPLKNNQVTYGPWFTQGMQGKVEFEQDLELNPWNYGGFSQMNAAGTAMVQDVYTNSIINESGSVEFPGSPLFSIAHQIFAGGPTITQISTSIGENGVTTTYRMEKWSQKFGDNTRHNLEQYKKIHKLQRDVSKKGQTKPVYPFDHVKFGSILSLKNIPRAKQPKSPHQMLMASTYGSGQYNIASMPFYETPTVLDTENWESIAGCALDTLFTPYSTYSRINTSGNISGIAVSGFTSNNNIPNFVKPSGAFPTVDDLNPFKKINTHSVVIHGAGVSGHTNINLSNIEEPSVFRSMALRSPLVLAGWGVSTSGNIVPEDISKTEDWKVGPLDTRWDELRGVWVAGGTLDYIKDLRITQSGQYKLFEYDKYTNGSGQWLVWFTAKGC